MADVVKNVELKFKADLSDVKKALAEAKSFTEDIQGTSKLMRKEGISGYKQVEKLSKNIQKHEKNTKGRAALNMERQLQARIKETVRDMNKKVKAFKGSTDAIKEEQRALRGLVQDLARVRKERKQVYGKTGGEQFRAGAGAAAGAGGALLSKIGGALMMGITSLLGSALGMITSQIGQGYTASRQFGATKGRLAGLGGKDASIEALRGTAVNLGFSPTEMAQQALPIARATGVVGGGALTTAMQIQRATAMDVGQTAGIMGTLTKSGSGFGGQAGNKGKREFEQMLAKGLASGIDQARMPEFFTSVTNLMQRQMGVAAGDVSGGGIASLLQRMGASGLSGLQGERGGAILAQLDQAIRRPGGGEAGQAFMLQAMGFGKPGGTASYYEALKKQEKGAFGEGNIEAMFSEAEAQYGGGESAVLALRNLTSLSINQLEQLREVVQSNKSSEEKQKEIKRIQEEAKPIDQQALEAVKESGDVLKDMAQLQNRSITIGDAVAADLNKIRDMINEAVMRSLPMVVAALKVLTELLAGIYELVQKTFGSKMTEEEKQLAVKRLDAAYGIGDISAQHRMYRQKRDAARDWDPLQAGLGGAVGMFGAAAEAGRQALSGERLDLGRVNQAFLDTSGITSNRERENFYTQMMTMTGRRQQAFSDLEASRNEVNIARSLDVGPGLSGTEEERVAQAQERIAQVNEIETAIRAGNALSLRLIEILERDGNQTAKAYEELVRARQQGQAVGNARETTLPTTTGGT